MPTFDNVQSSSEGWVIADCDGSANGPWQLQAIDEMPTFQGDHEAWQHVLDRNDAGSAYHRSALDFLLAHNPQEYHAIFRAVR